jgi:hypothetical protein
VGDTPGSLRSDPAGIMISRPLRVACGSGLPQFRQNEVEKLRAVERSKRATLSSPDNQRNAGGKTYAFAEEALPVALRHREQWHFTNLLNGRSASNSTNPQRHPPRTDMSHLQNGLFCNNGTPRLHRKYDAKFKNFAHWKVASYIPGCSHPFTF